MFHVWLKKMCILLLLSGMFYIFLLGSFGLECCPVLCFLIALLSGYSIHYGKWVIEVCYYYYVTVYFFLQICQLLLYLFRGSLVRWIYVYNCYIFLMNWSFCHYIISFFASSDSFLLKVYFVCISLALSALLFFYIFVEYLYHLFTFSLFVLKSRVSLL